MLRSSFCVIADVDVEIWMQIIHTNYSHLWPNELAGIVVDTHRDINPSLVVSGFYLCLEVRKSRIY